MITERSTRKKRKPKGIFTDAEIIAGELDTPIALESEWEIYRLGKPSEHLWMAQLIDPIDFDGIWTTHEYEMPFNFTITKVCFYQTTNLGVESVMPINLRFNILHPNRTPSIIYFEIGKVFVGGELTLTGARYSPAAELQFVVSGEDNLLHVNIEFEVHGVA